MILRPYQREMFTRVREEFLRGHRRVFLALPTGSGKTVIHSAMARGAHEKGRTTWICVPRRELITQTSETLARLDVPHGRIDAGHQESKAFSLHVVSKDTLLRRYDKIRVPPDFLILDEAHLYYDQQIEIQRRYPDARIVGVSASPERLDGRGLSDLYDVLVEGPDIRTLVEQHYLVPVRYYAPPIEGLEKLKKKGYDYDEGQVDDLLERAKIYGSAIDHYERHAAGRTALVFTRSVSAAERVAERFRERGWRFMSVSAKTKAAERATIIDALRDGGLHGVVNCEIATYGLDVPRVDCLIMLRPTLSKALHCQMVGRGLRPYPDKDHCVILDHVGLLAEHGHPLDPYEWKFDGREKRKRKKKLEVDPHLCPITWLYCTRENCVGCEHNRSGALDLREPEEPEIDGDLVEIRPIKLKHRPLSERREYQDRLGAAVDATMAGISRGKILTGPLTELLELARQVGHQPMWVYYQLSAGRATENVPLLYEIERIKGYKRGWAWLRLQELRQRRGRKVGTR